MSTWASRVRSKAVPKKFPLAEAVEQAAITYHLESSMSKEVRSVMWDSGKNHDSAVTWEAYDYQILGLLRLCLP